MHPGNSRVHLGEMQRRVQYGFKILLPVEDVLQLFEDNLKISRIAVVPQANRQPQIILDILSQSDR